MENSKLMKLIYLTFFAAVLFSITSCGEKKTAYINGQKVYDDFSLTKKKQKEFINQRDQRNSVLDSLKNNIVQIENNLRIKENPPKDELEKYRQLVQLFRSQSEQFEKENNQISIQYKDEILKMLLDYVKEYGKTNGYDYIYGDWDTGAIMYAAEGEDVTEEVIEFINQKYKE